MRRIMVADEQESEVKDMVDLKNIPVEEKELQTIAEIYKSLQDTNRNLWLMNGNILLASQNAHKKNRCSSRKTDR